MADGNDEVVAVALALALAFALAARTRTFPRFWGGQGPVQASEASQQSGLDYIKRQA